MQLEHSFTVPIPVERAWTVLTDIERIAPCMPGAALTDVRDGGEEFAGEVTVKVGPMQVTYEGTARFVELDDEGRSATIEAVGDQKRGAGTARATIRARLVTDGDDTTVTVTTDLEVTGRPAQFGRGVMADVGDKLLGQFADCLAEELTEEGELAAAEVEREREEVPGAPTEEPAREPATAQDRLAVPPPVKGDAALKAARQPSPRAPVGAAAERGERPRRTDEAIDLLEIAGPSVVKRAAPVVVALAVLAFIIWWFARDHEDRG